GAVHEPAVSVTHPGVGQAYILGTPATFNNSQPNAIFFSSNDAAARPVAVGWAIDAAGGEPAGWLGDNDTWSLINGRYWQPMWVIRGYENHPDMFAFSHPCIDVASSTGTLRSTADACYLASHTTPLEILVTNDDGIDAHGIDALVQGLKTVNGITFNIVAPATQQSGQGGNTTPDLSLADGAPGATLSGDAGTAISGFPADAVLYALNFLRLSPDVTMSGINDGQNLANVGNIASGTIGAARQSLTRGFPSMALSQGSITVTADFPAGAAASLALLEEWRLGNAGAPHMELPNLNIPSCDGTGTITGTVDTVVGVDLSSGNYFGVQNCASAQAVFVDDLDAFLNGWNSIADMGRVQPPNYP
ncbi:MAG: 5'/3'-nucleotidase SurE, partial [Halioglobus sp.]|nr:5'/3'-nucleotidase SurE [Halioglobus sp.]